MSCKEVVKEIVIKNQEKILSVTKRLRDFLGVNYVLYRRTKHNGDSYSIGDRPDWFEFFHHHKLQNVNPLARNPSLYKSGNYACQDIYDSMLTTDIMDAARRDFRMDHHHLIISKDEHGVEMLALAADPSHTRMQNMYFKSSKLIIKFIPYLRNELRELIEALEENPTSLPEQIPDYNELDVKFDCEVSASEFLLEIGLEKVVSRWKILTPRERECLDHLVDGNTVKQIAFHMGLSPRTAELYVNNIKLKWQCYDRGELIRQGKEFRDLNLSH